MEYKCNQCNKIYASYQSLWIHNKKFHINNKNNAIILPSLYNNNAIILPSLYNNNAIILPSLNKSLTCNKCLKVFTHRNNKYRHEKICKENKIVELEQNNIQLNNNTNIQLNDNKIINNNTLNNTYVINAIGSENIDKLTYEDIKKIFRQHKNSLYYAIEIVNFNENIPENHNFYNSSLEGKYINVFNTDTNTPEKKNKKDFFDKILLSSLKIMNLLYEKVKDSVSKVKQKSLLRMIEELDNIAHIDIHKKIYAINVNQMSYNKKELIKNTWNKTSKNNSTNLLEDTKYYSDSDSDSKDSFYYLTEESDNDIN
jgi:hypothetical protein